MTLARFDRIRSVTSITPSPLDNTDHSQRGSLPPGVQGYGAKHSSGVDGPVHILLLQQQLSSRDHGRDGNRSSNAVYLILLGSVRGSLNMFQRGVTPLCTSR